MEDAVALAFHYYTGIDPQETLETRTERFPAQTELERFPPQIEIPGAPDGLEPLREPRKKLSVFLVLSNPFFLIHASIQYGCIHEVRRKMEDGSTPLRRSLEGEQGRSLLLFAALSVVDLCRGLPL